MALYSKLVKLVPKGVRGAFGRQIKYVGMERDEKRLFGFLLAFGLFLSAGVSLNLYFFLSFPIAFGFLGFFVFFLAASYFWLEISAESRGKFVERVLPDALQLVASNIRSGLTLERALLASARPEFGPLSEELRGAGKRILTGEKAGKALASMCGSIRSKNFERTVWLLNKGIESGGEMSSILQQLSDDLREQNMLREEISANVSMYVLLIFFAAAIGAPIMLGISSFIVQIIHSQVSGLSAQTIASIQAQSMGGLVVVSNPVDPAFVSLFSQVALLVTMLFAAMTMGIINTGSEKQGVKYFPVLFIVGFFVFHATWHALQFVFAQVV